MSYNPRRRAYGKEADNSGGNFSHSQEETTLKTEDDIFAKADQPVDLNERTTQDTLDILHDGGQCLEGRVLSNDVVCASH